MHICKIFYNFAPCYMTNFFQTYAARSLFERSIYIELDPSCSCLAEIQGCGPTKRAIIQGGFRIDPTLNAKRSTLALMRQMRIQARRHGCIYAEMRCFDDYSPFHSSLVQAGWTYIPHYDVIIYPDREVPETKMRQINAAQAQGQTWREANSEDDVRDFYHCLSTLYRTKVHRPLPPLRFFIQAWRNGITLLVVTQNTPQPHIVGGVLMPILNSIAYEWYICGQVMSTWAMISYCRNNHITLIDMMGAGEPNVPYGVRDFKLQMGGELKEWGRYITILHPLIYRLGKWWINRHR